MTGLPLESTTWELPAYDISIISNTSLQKSTLCHKRKITGVFLTAVDTRDGVWPDSKVITRF